MSVNKDDIRLELIGFEGEPIFGSSAQGLVRDLHFEAPSDSTTTASFTRIKDTITGAIKIASSQGIFSVTASGLDPRAVLRRVSQDMRTQLGEWKRTRRFA